MSQQPKPGEVIIFEPTGTIYDASHDQESLTGPSKSFQPDKGPEGDAWERYVQEASRAAEDDERSQSWKKQVREANQDPFDQY